ncbi:MAG: zinc ribbon domain-containing protein, partial [Chloroflexi bacterium]|nr:zinc ribbon domain-containing protein [Chloroflexota bacterium]
MSRTNDSKPVVLQCPQCGGSLPQGAEGYLLCQYCGSSLILRTPASQPPSSPSAVVRGMLLKQFTYWDRQGTGLEVFRMLMPMGWRFQGGCCWLLDNPGMPATVSFQMSNPQGAEMFEVLPNINFTWSNNPLATLMHPVGSRYFGAEVRRPLGIREALRQIALPRYRAGVQNLQILREELQPDLPKLARSEAAISGGSAEGGRVRFCYTWHGVRFEEEMYGVVELFRAPAAGLFGGSETLIWYLDFLFTFRAAEGRLDATADLFTVMIRSFTLNPHWYAAFKSVAQFLARRQIQHIRHIGQIGQIVAQTGREIREQNLHDWYARQDIYDRLATDWSRTIRGV